MSELRYIHDETAHNLKDPKIIVPVIMDVLNPKSVVDVGCGIGTFLHVFSDYGVKKLLGLDGDWVDRELLSKHISLTDFKIIDIEKGFEIEDKFELAVCLEVLEHVDSAFADITVKSLTDLSDIIVFSAAIPGQMGQNHVNEQWPEYWIDKFKKYGFTFHDVFRPVFWNNKDLARWYKQNMFLVVKNGHENLISGFDKYFDSQINAQVHPEYFRLRVKEVEDMVLKYDELSYQHNTVMKGKTSFIIYPKIFAKYFLRKFFKIN